MFMPSTAMTAMTTATESTAQYDDYDDDETYMHTICQTTSSTIRLSKSYTLVCGRYGYTQDDKQPHGQSNEKTNNNMQGGAKKKCSHRQLTPYALTICSLVCITMCEHTLCRHNFNRLLLLFIYSRCQLFSYLRFVRIRF